MHGPQTPIMITVPVDARDGRPPNINDLATDYWIRPSTAQRNLIDLTSTQRFFSHFPVTGRRLPFPCSVYFEDQGNRQGINRTLVQMRIARSWKGNIIVVKHVHEEEHYSMSPGDEAVVIELLKQ